MCCQRYLYHDDASSVTFNGSQNWKLLETVGKQTGNDRKVTETAGKSEAKLEARTDKLIEMLAIEQEQTRLLMLPKPQPEPEQKKRGSWLGYFRLKR